jgi:hypothetical protein
MGKIRIAKASSTPDSAVGVGVTAAATHGRPIKVHGYSVASRVTDFVNDVQVDLIPGYTGLGEALNAFGGTDVLAAVPAYTSDFSSTVEGWVELTDGSLVFAVEPTAIGGVEDTLKVLSAAAPDDASMKKPSVCTVGKYYKVTLSIFVQTAAGLDGSFIGLGANTDPWDLTYQHDGGSHQIITAENAWYDDVTLYGKADATDLEICIYTAKNGATEDQIVDTKSVYFKNIVCTEVLGVGDWVATAEADHGWHGDDQSFSSDAGGAGLLTYTESTAAPAAGEIYQTAFTIDDWVANGFVTTFGGTILDLLADGDHVNYTESDGTATVILTADASTDMDIEALTVKKLGGVDMANSIYHHTIQAGQVEDRNIIFPAPVWVGQSGFWMNFTPSGATAILDVNVFYEII